MMTRVIYVIGWGRSGTTLLDMALGSFPGVVSTGELRYLWSRGLIDGDRCGCGSPVPACARWMSVLDRLEAARTAQDRRPARLDAADVVTLQQATGRLRHTVRLVRSPGSQERQLQEVTVDLARAILAETGDDIVVDSSKRPSDAALYLGSPDVALHLVHMVRDPRAVAHSWQRAKLRSDMATPREIGRHSPWRSSMHWLTWNLAAEWLAPRAASYRRVRYEDFVRDPATILGQILSDAGMEVDPGQVAGREGLALGVNHTVAGNPDRMRQGVVAVRQDDDWLTGQSAADRLSATAIALPLLRRYAYPVRVRPQA